MYTAIIFYVYLFIYLFKEWKLGFVKFSFILLIDILILLAWELVEVGQL